MGSQRGALPSESSDSVKEEPDVDSDVTCDPEDKPKVNQDPPEEHPYYVEDHVPKVYGLDNTSQYTFKGMTPTQRIAAIASIVSARTKGALFVEIDDNGEKVPQPRLNGEELTVSATSDPERRTVQPVSATVARRVL
jgi:hypothetical protein